VNEQTVGKEFEAWAHDEPEIKAVVMLGSRARESGQVGSSDDGSDWDFHVVTSDISLFKDATWTARAHLLTPLAYIARSGHVSRIVKSTGVFPNGEIDLVLLPLTNLRFAKLLMRIGIAERIPFVRDALSEMALVLLPGYRLVKGGHSWGKFFASVVTKIAPLRLSDHIVCELAEAYFVDYVSTRRKIMRGELIAAQRWLHTQLADTNFRLLHELRLRSNELSFPDGRRLEFLKADRWLEAIRVSALPDRECLLIAIEKSADTCRELVRSLVGTKWHWPNMPCMVNFPSTKSK
jgi:hypothetical protein